MFVPGRHVVLCGSVSASHFAATCWRCHALKERINLADQEKKSWQVAAITLVSRAKRMGALRNLDGSVACVDCGCAATIYDHRDYGKPLEVEPVCRSCNIKRGAATWPMSRRSKAALAALKKAVNKHKTS